jgi:hypothetical protein
MSLCCLSFRVSALHQLRASSSTAAQCKPRHDRMLLHAPASAAAHVRAYSEDTSRELPRVQSTVLESSNKVGRVVSPDGRRVLSLIESAPAEAAELVLQLVRGMLSQLGGIPTSQLVDAAMHAYNTSGDLQLLALLMPGMPKELAKQHAPALVKLQSTSVEAFREAVRRTVSSSGTRRPASLAPRDLLMTLHTVDHAEYNVRSPLPPVLRPCAPVARDGVCSA